MSELMPEYVEACIKDLECMVNERYGTNLRCSCFTCEMERMMGDE